MRLRIQRTPSSVARPHRLKPSMRRPLRVKGLCGFSSPFRRKFLRRQTGGARMPSPPSGRFLLCPPISFNADQREAVLKLPLHPFPGKGFDFSSRHHNFVCRPAGGISSSSFPLRTPSPLRPRPIRPASIRTLIGVCSGCQLGSFVNRWVLPICSSN